MTALLAVLISAFFASPTALADGARKASRRAHHERIRHAPALASSSPSASESERPIARSRPVMEERSRLRSIGVGAAIALIPIGAALLVTGGVLFPKMKAICIDEAYRCANYNPYYKDHSSYPTYYQTFYKDVRKHPTLSTGLMVGGAVTLVVGAVILTLSMVGGEHRRRSASLGPTSKWLSAASSVHPWFMTHASEATGASFGMSTTQRF